jgi:hypothetical protein
MWSVPCPLLGNGSLNTFPQKQTRGTTGDLLLGNGALNRLYQQYRLFSVGSVQSDYKIVEFRSWQFSSVTELSVQLWNVNQRTTEADESPVLRFVVRKCLVKKR